MSYGIKITKRGYDVQTEVNPKNFIFHSDFNHLKTSSSGEVNIDNVSTSSNSEISIAHGLGIRPLVIAYWRELADSKWFIVMSNPEQTTVRRLTDLNVEVYVDITNVYFNAQNQSGSTKSFVIKYEIFYEGDA